MDQYPYCMGLLRLGLILGLGRTWTMESLTHSPRRLTTVAGACLTLGFTLNKALS